MERTIKIKLSDELETKILEDCKQQQAFMEGLPDDLRPTDTRWTVEDQLEMLLEKILKERYGNKE